VKRLVVLLIPLLAVPGCGALVVTLRFGPGDVRNECRCGDKELKPDAHVVDKVVP
jgi:hypothetical protein